MEQAGEWEQQGLFAVGTPHRPLVMIALALAAIVVTALAAPPGLARAEPGCAYRGTA